MAAAPRKRTPDAPKLPQSHISPVQFLLPQLKESRRPKRKRYRPDRKLRSSGPHLVVYLADRNSTTPPGEAQRRADAARAGRMRVAFVAFVLAVVWVWFFVRA